MMMAKNNLKKMLEQEGIKQIELSRETGIAAGTINRVCGMRLTLSPTYCSKMLKGFNKLSKKEFDIEDIFPTDNKKRVR